MATRADALVVLAKAPLPGNVKSRLVPPLSAEQAADLARALLLDQLNHLRSLAGADLYLAFAPAESESMMRRLVPARYRCFPQAGGDLGQRMQAAFAELFDGGYQRIVLIGGDLPAVPLPFFEQAYAFLRSSEQSVVLGPSSDGGYFLVGCNCLTPQIFSGIDWGQPHVLEQTVARLAAFKIAYQLLPEWFDVDTADDMVNLESLLCRSLGNAMPQTATLLRRLRLNQ
jgi:rSAM/selenodomain-associated transferase 1